MEIRILKLEDLGTLTEVASGVFDDSVNEARSREFLSDPRHHLIVAIDDDLIVGMISVVHYVHPDKPAPEMWINEVSVAKTHRGRGLGKAMMSKVLDVARELGCREAWVLTDRANDAAMKLYESSGGVEAKPDSVMFTFFLD